MPTQSELRQAEVVADMSVGDHHRVDRLPTSLFLAGELVQATELRFDLWRRFDQTQTATVAVVNGQARRVQLTPRQPGRLAAWFRTTDVGQPTILGDPQDHQLQAACRCRRRYLAGIAQERETE